MADNYSKTKLKSDASLLQESEDREGKWTREFNSRSIIWPVLEHWAAENGYRLVSLRGNRRLYQFGRDSTQFITYLDIKQDETRVALRAWTDVKKLSRALRLFLIPAQLNIDPKGYLAVRYRRRVCHQLNEFLTRLRQPPILFSQGFHWVDLDLTTVIISITLVFPLFFFTYLSLPSLAIAPSALLRIETYDLVFRTLGSPTLILFSSALVLIIIHHWVTVKRVNLPWAKNLSAFLGIVLIGSVSLGMCQRTKRTMLLSELNLHCIHQRNPELCQNIVFNRLTREERLSMREKLKAFYQELTLAEKAHRAFGQNSKEGSQNKTRPPTSTEKQF